MTPTQLKQLREWARTREGKKLTQKLAAERLGIGQSALSRAEDEGGNLMLASETTKRYAELLTPKVRFISGHCAEIVASVIAQLEEGVAVIDDPVFFADLLRTGQMIVVVAADKAPYLELIQQALDDSGLSSIDVRAVDIGKNGYVRKVEG